MKRERVLFDQTEVTMAVVVGKKAKVLHLPYDRITSITIEPFTAKKLFKTIETERIVVRAGGHAEPYVFRGDQESPYFENYKEGFRKFCRENHITFYDKTQADA